MTYEQLLRKQYRDSSLTNFKPCHISVLMHFKSLDNLKKQNIDLFLLTGYNIGND